MKGDIRYFKLKIDLAIYLIETKDMGNTYQARWEKNKCTSTAGHYQAALGLAYKLQGKGLFKEFELEERKGNADRHITG